LAIGVDLIAVNQVMVKYLINGLNLYYKYLFKTFDNSRITKGMRKGGKNKYLKYKEALESNYECQ